MKIIHTADLHLDSPLGNVIDGNLRRRELFDAFRQMVDYALQNGVDAIIIAGDLFDGDFVKNGTIANVAEIINNSKLQWFVARGNHASKLPYDKLKELSPSVNFFGDEWTTYKLDGNVNVVGRELGSNDELNWQNFALENGYNVVVLHGDVANASYGFIDGNALAKSNADYVALGHRHEHSVFKFGKVTCVYSGVLESRGFDENGETGFVVLDTETGTNTFVKQHLRRVVSVCVDVTGAESDVQLEMRIEKATEDVSTKNYLNLVLVGTLAPSINLQNAVTCANKFFAFRLQDDTEAFVDVNALASEVSLRGEFVKLANSIDDEYVRKTVIKYGLKALDGEGVL